MPFYNSTAIIRAEYNNGSMQIWFPNSGPYNFCSVPESVFIGLDQATSKGTYYNDHIRDRYQC